MLLTVEDWQRVEGREVPPRKGKPLVGVDLGGGRAWVCGGCPCGKTGAVETSWP